MKRGRILILLSISWASIGRADALQYQSTHTPLTYAFETHDSTPTGRVTSMSMQTEVGTLTGTFTYASASEPFRAVFVHTASGENVQIDVVPSHEPNIAVVQWAWSNFGAMHMVLNVGTSTIVSTSSTISDCDGLVASSIYRALYGASDAVIRDLQAKNDQGAVLPAHETVINPLLLFGGAVSRVVEACRNSFMVGGCSYFGGPDASWATCKFCCEKNNVHGMSREGTAVCALLALLCTTGPWCRGGIAACEAVALSFDYDTCMDKSCEGKPGDPGCDRSSAANCSAVGGRCQVRCTGFQDSTCASGCDPMDTCCN